MIFSLRIAICGIYSIVQQTILLIFNPNGFEHGCYTLICGPFSEVRTKPWRFLGTVQSQNSSPLQRVSDPWSEVQAEQHADAFQLPGRRRDCRERLGCRKMKGDTVVVEDPKSRRPEIASLSTQNGAFYVGNFRE
jgi:hypothetical protein